MTQTCRRGNSFYYFYLFKKSQIIGHKKGRIFLFFKWRLKTGESTEHKKLFDF